MEAALKQRRIAFVVADPATATAFLVEHLRALSQRYDVTLIANTSDPQFLRSLGIEGETCPVRIERSISPIRDLQALFRLALLFRRERFDAVHSVTPKAGLLAMTAAAIAGIPMRTHTFTGQVWVTKSGLARRGLKALDRLTHRMTTFTLVDSPSQLAFLVAERVVRPNKAAVLADGSISGIDSRRFRPDPDARSEIRKKLSIEAHQIMLLYVGRLRIDKGVLDLARAFADLNSTYPDARLVLVGPDEERLSKRVMAALGTAAGAARIEGGTATPETYMAAADLFCLPSYREGFGSVLLEAAAAGVPALASAIYGITDAVEDGVTGLLHPPRDTAAITDLMKRLVEDPALLRRLGQAARTRALQRFSSERLTDAMVAYYEDSLPSETPSDRG
jgi:glycosyltransferase involved in cell wall biosynthesis